MPLEKRNRAGRMNAVINAFLIADCGKQMRMLVVASMERRIGSKFAVVMLHVHVLQCEVVGVRMAVVSASVAEQS